MKRNLLRPFRNVMLPCNGVRNFCYSVEYDYYDEYEERQRPTLTRGEEEELRWNKNFEALSLVSNQMNTSHIPISTKVMHT